MRWLSAKQVKPGQRQVTIRGLIHLLGPDPLACHLMDGGRPMIRTHSLVVGVASFPGPPNNKLFRLLPQREWFWVRLTWTFEPRFNLVLPPSADAIDHDLPNQGIIDGSSKVLLNFMNRYRFRVVVSGGANGLGDDKAVPRGMEIYTREVSIFSIQSLVDERKLLTRNTPIPSDLVTVTATVPTGQM